MSKYINLKYLIESIDDEDFFSDLGYDTGKEVTFLVDNNISVKNLGTNPTLKDIENVEHIGSILSNLNGDWLLWNLNNEYWDPYGIELTVPTTDEFGEIIAVCVGKGMFAKIGWTGLTCRYRWANDNEPINLTKHKINIDGSGYVSTMNIINNYSEYIKDTIWEHLVNESTLEYLLYLPNIKELESICNNVGNYEKLENTNIYKLLCLTTDNYWSSSLYVSHISNYIYTYYIYINSGETYFSDLTIAYLSVAFLHF